MQQSLPPHLPHQQQQQQQQQQQGGTPVNINETSQSSFPAHKDNTNNTFPSNPHKGHTSPSSSASKQPYGSGDTDDGYTLVFPNLDAFHEWRNAEEERQMVEFVKGDTHGSKALPPRFKDHTKLVCARHSRSGRKKYIKKHPERVRKVPSRKLEGQGCPASISFKTYFDSEEVRACYLSQHSHEIGLANLPYTRRGRKAAVQQEKVRTRKQSEQAEESSSTGPPSTHDNNALAGPSTAPQATNPFTSAITMVPPHISYQAPPPPPPQTYGYAPPPPQPYHPPPSHPALSHGRWENMVTLFNTVRENARNFEYPSFSVAALETVLIRLYLESPGLNTLPTMGALMQNGVVQPQIPVGAQSMNVANNGNGRDVNGGMGGEDNS